MIYSTLILLYAFDAGQIPVGCYIAAWALASIKFVASLAEMASNIAKHKK